jgi:hypothetical protein
MLNFIVSIIDDNSRVQTANLLIHGKPAIFASESPIKATKLLITSFGI